MIISIFYFVPFSFSVAFSISHCFIQVSQRYGDKDVVWAVSSDVMRTEAGGCLVWWCVPWWASGFPGSSAGKRIHLQCRRPRFNSWEWEDLLEKGWATHSSFLGFPGGSAGKESACNAGDLGSIPGLGQTWVGNIPSRRERLPFQSSGLDNSVVFSIIHILDFLTIKKGNGTTWYLRSLPVVKVCCPSSRDKSVDGFDLQRQVLFSSSTLNFPESFLSSSSGTEKCAGVYVWSHCSDLGFFPYTSFLFYVTEIQVLLCHQGKINPIMSFSLFIPCQVFISLLG